jgi:non-ribosomal peptide synthase protein (TIGR01720 family)
LQTAIVAGEACPKRVVEQHYRLLPGTALFSEYGATENTVFNAVYDCREQTLDTAPIGRPIANAEIYLLDENLQPVPTGVPGEAYFGGPALSPGYLNRPDLNAERFIPHPFSDDPAARLYKSGDLLRHLPGGDVEFLGRTDNQVKIRGFRIELEEIEAVLLRHPSVREAAVLAVTAEDWYDKGSSPVRADDVEQGGKRLAAYVAVADGPSPAVSDLRRFLSDQLPDHMVPAAFVVLGSLPKHPNGKIDRRALPAPGSVRAEPETAYEAPRSATENTLAEIWRQVLGLAQVGVHDNFFELGGDSILSIQIVARASRAGLSVTPMQIFQHQTIAELAEHVRVAHHVAAEQGEVTGDVPLSPIQQWFCQRRSPDMHHWNMPLLLRLKTAVPRSDLQQAAQALLRHHDALRLRLRPSGTGWRQHIAVPEEMPVVEWVDLSEAPAAEQQSRFETLAATYQQSLNLETGPLMRLIVFDFGPARGQELFWVLHHLAVDIVSWRILLEDLESALEQLALGGPVRLPPKTTSFKRWSELLQQYAGSDVVARAAGVWLTDEHRNAAPIPVDRAQAQEGNTEESQRRFQVRLSRDETDRLLHDVPKAYQTQINEVLLTALLRCVSEWSNQSSLLVEIESHGREEDLFDDVDLSRTVGWFTTYYPVCLRSNPSASLEETLQSVKQQLRGIPDRGFQYSVLRHLAPGSGLTGELQRLPQADINFNYLGQFGQVLRNSSLFSAAPPDVNYGLDRSARGLRSHPLEVVSWVIDGCLLVDWYYSENIHDTSTIERLGQGFIKAVRSLLDHKTDARGQDVSPDHDAFGWELPDLEGIAAAIQKARGNT